MSTFHNRVRVATATAGTGTITLGQASAGYCSFSEGGVANGATVTYTIEDGTSFEVGRGVYDSSALTLTRAAILISKIAGQPADTTPLTLSGSAVVFVTAAAEDLLTRTAALTDNAVIRGDGGAAGAQTSSVLIDDDDNVTGVNRLGVGGATPDATNVLSANLPAVLFNHAGTSAQIKVNKNATANTASHIFQVGFSGRAEFGLIASDDFQVKTSSNGSTFNTGLTVLASNAGVRVHVDIAPSASDGAALGSTSLMWSDLFLASGAVLNFDNGNYTVTHSTGLLTLSGPLSLGTSNALTVGSIELGAAVDTTLSRPSAGNVAIEGNVIYRAGGTDVPVADGGSGRSDATAYAVICGGTTSGGAHQSIASVGTSGQILTSNGAGALPTFQTSAAAIVSVVASGAVSSAAQVDISIGSADMYEVEFQQMAPTTDAVNPELRFSQSSSFLAGASDYAWQIFRRAVAGANAGFAEEDAADSEIQLSGSVGNAAGEYFTGKFRIWRPSAASFYKEVLCEFAYFDSSGNMRMGAAHGRLAANTNAIDGIRFRFSSGDIASGYYAVRSFSFT